MRLLITLIFYSMTDKASDMIKLDFSKRDIISLHNDQKLTLLFAIHDLRFIQKTKVSIITGSISHLHFFISFILIIAFRS